MHLKDYAADTESDAEMDTDRGSQTSGCLAQAWSKAECRGNLQCSVPFTRDNRTLPAVSEDAILPAEQSLAGKIALGVAVWACVWRGGDERDRGGRGVPGDSSRRLDSVPSLLQDPECASR